MFLLILATLIYSTVNAAHVYRYDAPIVTIRAGNAWTINGNFKLIHTINLSEYTTIANNITTLVEQHMPPSQNKDVLKYHLIQIQQRISELQGIRNRNRRSINWIGSAWKWVAGSPDATDWDTILGSQNALISNNNELYKINSQLLDTTNEVVLKTNQLISRMNEISSGKEAERIEQGTISQVLVLKDVINEVVRACQLAKSGIINTNLLDKAEVENIITEIETLPYANAVEAIEYGNPSVYTNGSLLLYVLSIPKLKHDFYHRLITRAAVRQGKQIELPFNEILINQNETFGVKSSCLNINEVMVCQQSSLSQLSEETCIPRLLKGGHASCDYKLVKMKIREMISSDTIFVTNYEGHLKTQYNTELLNGTYLIQLFNETIMLDNEAFSSTSVSKLEPLPSILTSMTNEKLLVDIDQVHNISLHNVNKLQYLKMKLDLSLGIYFGFIALIGICIGFIWHRITRRLNLPTIQSHGISDPTSQTNHAICGTQIFERGGVNTTVNCAN